MLLYLKEEGNSDNSCIFVVKVWGRFAKQAGDFEIGRIYLLESVKILTSEIEFIGCYHESSKGFIKPIMEKDNKRNEFVKTENVNMIKVFKDMQIWGCGLYFIQFEVVTLLGFPLDTFYIKMNCKCQNLTLENECITCLSTEINHYKIIALDSAGVNLIFTIKNFIKPKKNQVKYKAIIAKDEIVGKELYIIMEFIN